MWHIIQYLFNEVNELLGSSPFSDVSFLLKVCRHAQNYTEFGDKSVSGCCKDTPSRKSARKQKMGSGTSEGRILSLLLKEVEEDENGEGPYQRCCWRKYSSMIS